MKARYTLLAVAAAFATLIALPLMGTAQQTVTYTAEQAVVGRTAYSQSCAECHLDNMQGSFEAPQLAGPNFLSFWGGRPANELLEMVALMPPDEEGSLGDAVYSAITAYILARNGFPVGDAALTSGTAATWSTRAPSDSSETTVKTPAVECN